MPRVSVAILTYNRKEAVLKAIASVREQALDDVEIVVVDSASSDGTAEAIRTCAPDVKLIRLPRNLGCPGGRNHAFANCTGDYIVNVDDDGFLGRDALRGVVEIFAADPAIGIVAMRQVFTDEPQASRVIADEQREVSSFWGGVSAFRREMLEKTGYYPEDFFLYGEEAYLAIRAMDCGFKIVSAPDCIMWHPRRGVSASGGAAWDYYRYRNALLIVTRLFPGRLLVKYLVLRIGSYFSLAIRRRTVHKYLCALACVLWRLPGTLLCRRPCSSAAVLKYFRLRSASTRD